MPVPLIRPNPPRLSRAGEQLRKIEDSGIFSNFGPANTAFEQDMVARMFGGEGACMTVCNATIGLMLAVQQAIGARPTGTKYALMPSFTFAAAAHAAMWCGLTPLFCDIDPATWTASPADEERLIAQYGADIAVVMPYATFGFDLDLDRYTALTARHGIPVVVDAAASLGTTSADGRGFGAGFGGLIVYSMHATKSFSTGEGGVIYSADPAAIATLRQMCNFGFGKPRNATMPGLNAKLSEVGALLAHLRLGENDAMIAHRSALMQGYRDALPELAFQAQRPGHQAHQFAPALLPQGMAPHRTDIVTSLMQRGVGCATYFSPHLLQQDYFSGYTLGGALPVTDDVGNHIISLPLFDDMTAHDLAEVVTTLREEMARFAAPPRQPRVRPSPATLQPAMALHSTPSSSPAW